MYNNIYQNINILIISNWKIYPERLLAGEKHIHLKTEDKWLYIVSPFMSRIFCVTAP